MKTDAASPSPARSSLAPVVGGFLAGSVLVSALWVHSHQATPATKASALSAGTRDLLSQLKDPVTLRYYELLPGNTNGQLQAFADRVNDLLASVQAAAGDKIQLVTKDQANPADVDAAGKDGLQAFNLDKGDANFLGIAVTSGKSEEALARLQPEWEPALEFDLVRTIVRVAAAGEPPKTAPSVPPPSTDTLAAIHRLIPDINATSADDADQIFHGEFVKQLVAAGTESEAQISAAQQQVIQATGKGSDADIAAAKKHLADLQQAQVEKFKAISDQLASENALFQQMKAQSAAK